jgi:sporulation protein YlmC with PRC-barrel domain
VRASDLQGKRVVSEAGERLGCVGEIHTQGGEVTALTVGAGGLLQRFLNSRRGKRVAWDQVLRMTDREIVVR